MFKNIRQLFRFFVIPTHHWDPFWKFAPEVSEYMGVRNIRKALDIIKENPDFKYTIGQIYLWELFQKYFPERYEELKQRVKEGKIELACGAYINPDFNLPSGESLIRNLAYCQQTWQKEFGVKPKVAWIQDSFGQSGQLPQIFQKLGIEFHTAKRGASRDLPAVFVWQGVDGTEIIFDRQPLGHHGITQFPWFSMLPSRIKPSEKYEKSMKPFFLPLALAAIYLPDTQVWISTKSRARSFREALNLLSYSYPTEIIFIPHGFGADGAMPVGWISYFCRIYSRLSGNKMVISSATEFFKEIEKIKNKLIVVRGELNGPTEVGEAFGALPGSYSTRSDVKQRARTMERLLYLVELLESFRLLIHGKSRDITELWKQKFLTDFHDGICGTLTDENYLLLRNKALEVIKQCQTIIRKDLSYLASKSVFNPLPWLREDIVKVNRRMQLVKAEPLGFTSVQPIATNKKFVFDGDCRLTTPFYRVKWTTDNNLVIYQEGKEITGPKFARIRLQNENGDSYFWDVSGEEWNKVKSIKLIEWKGLRATLEIKSQLRKIKIKQLIHFYLHTPRVDFETIIDNQEKDVRLQVCLPFNLDTQINSLIDASSYQRAGTDISVDQRSNPGESAYKVEREIPAGFIREGESTGQAKWEDIFGSRYAYYDNIKCVQNWLYLGNHKKGIAIFNDGLPEHEIVGQTCWITLLRCVGRVGTVGKGLNKFNPPNVPWAAGGPHPIPLAQMQGKHKFRYAFCPVRREEVAKRCYEFLFPLIFCQGQNKNKNLSLFSISDKSVIPLAIKKSKEGDNIVIRLLETEGKTKTVELKFNPNIQIKSARLTNLLEEPITDLAINNNTLKLEIRPQEIITIVVSSNFKKLR